MFRDLMVVMFAIAAGFTASGIVSNLYKILAGSKAGLAEGGVTYIAVMVVAGPNVLFEAAAAKLRARDCSRLAFWLAAALSAYWSFAIGLLVLNVVVVI